MNEIKIRIQYRQHNENKVLITRIEGWYELQDSLLANNIVAEEVTEILVVQEVKDWNITDLT